MKFSIMRSIDTKRYPSLIGQSVEDLESFQLLWDNHLFEADNFSIGFIEKS